MFRSRLIQAALLASLTALSLAQTQCASPEFFGASAILAVGERLFDETIGSDQCNTSASVSGSVFLTRPGDSSYSPLYVGTFNDVNGSAPISTPIPGAALGYGYQVVIAVDSSSVSSPLVSSPTFALVDSGWYNQSYGDIELMVPNTEYDTMWSSTGQQLLSWQSFKVVASSFDVLLYNANDVSAAPVTVLSNVYNPYADETTNELFFTPESTLPTGSNYQLVLVASGGDTTKVLAMSGLLQIVDSSVTTNTFPHTYTQVRTVVGSSTPVTSSSSNISSAAIPTASASSTISSTPSNASTSTLLITASSSLSPASANGTSTMVAGSTSVVGSTSAVSMSASSVPSSSVSQSSLFGIPSTPTPSSFSSSGVISTTDSSAPPSNSSTPFASTISTTATTSPTPSTLHPTSPTTPASSSSLVVATATVFLTTLTTSSGASSAAVTTISIFKPATSSTTSSRPSLTSSFNPLEPSTKSGATSSKPTNLYFYFVLLVGVISIFGHVL